MTQQRIELLKYIESFSWKTLLIRKKTKHMRWLILCLLKEEPALLMFNDLYFIKHHTSKINRNYNELFKTFE